MKYLEHYLKLINRAQNRDIDFKNGEWHHFIPKSIFNTKFINEAIPNKIEKVEDEENYVYLTFREHYIVHALLIRICEHNKNCFEKMHNAFNLMKNRNKNNRQYDLFKQEYRLMLSESKKGKPSPAKGKKWSEESKQNKKDNHVMTGKTYEELYGNEKANELKENRKNFRTGYINSDITRQKLSNRVITKEWREGISKANSGKIRTEEQKQKIKDFFSDPNKNPNIDQTLYKFYNVDGRELISRKYEMKKIYGCNLIHKVIREIGKTNMGWYYKGEIVNTLTMEILDD